MSNRTLIDWFEVPANMSKAGTKLNVVRQFLATKCICDQHPAETYVLASDYIVVACLVKGHAWLRKPDDLDLDLFEKSMTTVEKKKLESTDKSE